MSGTENEQQRLVAEKTDPESRRMTQEHRGTTSHGPGEEHRDAAYGTTSLSAEDPEVQKPVLGFMAKAKDAMGTKAHDALGAIDAASHKLVKRSEVQDSMTYHASDLASWGSLMYTAFTVWRRHSLWMVTLKLLGLSMVVGVLVLCICSDPAALQVSKFTEISNFLRVFVGLLLGFFMSASVNRWWACAEGFQRLCGSVRGLHIYLNSCGVPEELMTKILRYGVVSTWILHMQLHCEALPAEEQAKGVEEGWEVIRQCEGHDQHLGKLSEEDFEVLKGASDPPGALWMWMGSMLGMMAEEGHIPGLASPTYGRFMGVITDGFNAIRDVRTSISVQAPFIYVQMLSSLVHINNIVNAISFGLTFGASMGTLLVRHDGHKDLPNSDPNAQASRREVTADMQTLLVSFFFSCFGPFVYQALLEVSIAIAQPFSNVDAVVPTHRILRLLERDLYDSMTLAKQISWKQPCFKK